MSPHDPSACPACGYLNIALAKYCSECGAGLHRRCGRCGGEVSRGAKFCAECGVSLELSPTSGLTAADTHSTTERRQLTVLFCDLADSVGWSSRLDPEDLRELMTAYHAVVSAVVARFDGFVAQHLGDGVLVYFGYPQAHEDDASRAVHAALAIVAELDDLRQQTHARHGSEVVVRIGVHTGIVVIGAIGDPTLPHQAQLALGETPNLAARVQGLAPPNAVLTSDLTRRLAGGSFVYADYGTHSVKGLQAPVQIWRVVGTNAMDRYAALTQQRLTPLVGRTQEIELLVERWNLAQEGDGQVVLLSGQPGIGKSRTMNALRERLGASVHTILRFQCSPYHLNSAYHPLIAHLEQALEFGVDDTPSARLDKLESLVRQRLRRSARDTQMIAALLGLPGERFPAVISTPQRDKDDTLVALVELTAATSREQPTVVFFEDVHWADPTTLEYLGLLIERTRSLPLLLVLTHRPEFHSTWTQHGHVAALALSRLSRAQSAQAIVKITGDKSLPADLVEQLVEKADGVPLYLEELTKSVLESGQLAIHGDRFVAAAHVGVVAIPASLRDSLTARFDRIPDVKTVAQIGAAIGREFDYPLLAAVAPFDPRQLDRALDQLVESGLAFRRGSGGSATYTFKHALVQDAAYESMVKTRRQELHRQIATALETLAPTMKVSAPELFARHYQAAGMLAVALPLWFQAGQLALARTAVKEAVSHLHAALDSLSLLPASATRDVQELDIRVVLGGAWILLGGWQAREVQLTLEPALPLAHALQRHDALLPIYYGLWANVMTQGRIDEALQWIPKTLATAEHFNDRELSLLGHLMGTINKSWRGDWIGARQHGAEIDRLYDASQDLHLTPILTANFKQSVGDYSTQWLWHLGFPDQAAAASDAKDEHAKSLHYPFLVGFALTVGALAYYFRGDAAALDARAEKAIALGREFRLPIYADAMGPMNKGLAVLLAGRAEEAIPIIEQGLAAWAATGAGIYCPGMYSALTEACAMIGDMPSASAHIDTSLEQLERPGWQEHMWYADSLRIKGRLLAQQGKLFEAERYLEQALGIARAQQTKSLELRVATTLAELWQHDRPQQAHNLLKPIYDWFTEGFATRDLIRAKDLLAALAAATGAQNH
jgi:class 3 adenylate cyclase/tetratricopeptide (TPR) repeat protein